MEKSCNYCGKIFHRNHRDSDMQWMARRFCSHGCYGNSMVGKPPISQPPHKPIRFLTCKQCGRVVKRRRSSSIFCSRKCSSLNSRRKPKICKNCKKEFSQNGAKIYCSTKCMGEYQRGSNSPTWRGGIRRDRDRRKSFSCVSWKNIVLKRDGYMCQICKIRGGYLQPHHILFYSLFPSRRSEVENGITLCKNCHLIVHGIIHKRHIAHRGKTKNPQKLFWRLLGSPSLLPD